MWYKDDVNFVIDVNDDEVIAARRYERDRSVMERVKKIADGIHPSIQVDVDGGYNHIQEGGRLPILDLEVWIGDGVDGKRRILHSHYMKDVSSRLVMAERSAHGKNTKRNVMINEISRILRNCSVHIPWNEIARKVSYFVRRMEYCGYDRAFRYNVVRVALSRYKEVLSRLERGERIFAQGDSARKRKQKKIDWYKEDGKYESVMFIQPTPGSILKHRIQKLAKRNGVKVKVIEKAGLTVKKELQKSNPFGKKRCERVDCVICQHGKEGICRTRGCGYELMCKEDNRKYVGQTGRSVYERIGEEVRGWHNRDEKNPLWRHSELYHEGREFEYEVKITNRDFGRPSRRLITEGVLIEKLDEGKTMNSKRESGHIQT